MCPTNLRNQYEPKLINQTYRLQGELVVISDIPAEVCPICGDVLLTPATARKIEHLLRHHGPADSSAPIYRLATG